MKLAFAIITLIGLNALSACSENSTKREKELTAQPVITVIGHTRNSDPNENYIPSKVLQTLEQTEGTVMMLGDLAFYTTKDSKVLEKLSTSIDLKRDDVLFAPGNHDITDRQVLAKYFTSSYPQSYRKDDVLIIAMDTEMNGGNIINEQFDNLQKILTDNSDAKNIVIGTHQLIWLQDDGYYESIADSLINGYVGDCSYCLRENNFYEEVLPMIEASCPEADLIFVAGDVGHKVTHYITKFNDRISFMAIGNNGEKTNVMLKFYRDDNRQLTSEVSVDI